jgi:hypothetical protein
VSARTGRGVRLRARERRRAGRSVTPTDLFERAVGYLPATLQHDDARTFAFEQLALFASADPDAWGAIVEAMANGTSRGVLRDVVLRAIEAGAVGAGEVAAELLAGVDG